MLFEGLFRTKGNALSLHQDLNSGCRDYFPRAISITPPSINLSLYIFIRKQVCARVCVITLLNIDVGCIFISYILLNVHSHAHAYTDKYINTSL